RRGLQVLRKAVALAKQLREPYALSRVADATGFILLIGGRFRQALAWLDRSRSLSHTHCTGTSFEIASANAYVMWTLFMLGRIRGLCGELPALVAAASGRGDVYAGAMLRLGPCISAWLAADDVAGARRELREAMERLALDGVTLQHLLEVQALTHIDLYAG